MIEWFLNWSCNDCDKKYSGQSNRLLTPMLLKGIAIQLPLLSRYFCKSMPSSWQKVVYTVICGCARSFPERSYCELFARDRRKCSDLLFYFRPTISRESGRKTVHKKSSTFSKVHRNSFFTIATLGAGGPNIWCRSIPKEWYLTSSVLLLLRESLAFLSVFLSFP